MAQRQRSLESLKWFGPPVFTSEQQTAEARTFWMLASSAFVLTAIGVVILLIAEPLQGGRRLVTFGLLGGMILLFHAANRAGRTRAASWGLVMGFVAIATVRAWNNGAGLRAPVAQFYFIAVMMAALLIGRVGSTITAIAAIAGAAALAAGQQLGYLTASSSSGPWAALAVTGMTIAISAIVQNLMADSLRGNLRRAESELVERRRAEARLRLAVEAGRLGVWEFDTATRSFYADQLTLDLYQVSAAPDGSFPFEEWLARVHPDDRVRMRDRNAASLRGTSPSPAEFRVVLPDGQTHYLFSAALLLPGATGSIARIVGVNADITERKVSELERERRLQELVTTRTAELQTSLAKQQELERLRDDLVHMIVHDFRSPLTALLGGLELAKTQVSGPVAEYVDMAYAGAESLNEMANTLLDVRRMEEGKMPLNLAASDLVAVAGNAAGRLASMDRSRGLTVVGDSAVTGICDADLVRRVLENLISNAIKHTPSGGTVMIRVTALGDRVRLAVEDSGQGIPVEARARIFEKFGAMHARSDRSYHSVGLGLAFCKLAVEAHGGTIGIDSAEPHGSIFWFELPHLRAT